jgi:integrase
MTIIKANWRYTKIYLEYRCKVDQLSTGSMKVEETYIRYILEWCGSVPFLKVKTIRPTLPEYLLSARLDDSKEQLSCTYTKKILATARRFFTWLFDNYPEYRGINQAWVKTLKSKRLPAAPQNKDIVSLEEILAIASAPVDDTFERRIRAAVVFLYLSGMRIGAFVTMPIKAVDFPNRTIMQYPSIGVKTKNGKAAKTNLLNIPELIEIVQAWDKEVRLLLPENGFWFAPLSPDLREIDQTRLTIGEHREDNARKNIKRWLDKVGLPYHSPHKFRHGHIHYGMNRSKSIADYKAVSLNVMHASMEITDQFYSVQNDSEVKNRIDGLGSVKNVNLGEVNLVAALQELLKDYANK